VKFRLASLTVAVAVCLTLGVFASVRDILDADYEALEQPFGTAAARGTATISAKLGYLWTLPDHTQAMVLEGAVKIELPHQELTAENAVIWVTVTDELGGADKRLEIFLEGDAQVLERGGAVTSDQTLLVTAYTNARVELVGQTMIERDGSDQPIYQRALEARVRAPEAVEAPVPAEQVLIHPPAEAVEPEPARPILFRGNFVMAPEVEGQQTLLFTEGVYLLQSGPPDGEATELRATNAVLFLRQGAVKSSVLTGERETPKLPTLPPAAQTQPSPEQLEKGLEALPTEEEAAREISSQERLQLNEAISAAYLEGDVVISRGYRVIRADRVYYDFETSTAYIEDMVAFAPAPERNVPVYVRAARARQLSEREYVAYDAKLTTSEFYSPSYHIGATKVYLEDRTERSEIGEQVGLVASRYKVYNPTLNVQGLPILYWPYLQGDFKQGETSIRSVRTSYDSQFGTSGETRWHLFPVLGLETPEGTDATLYADYFGDRGPATGVDLDYLRDDYFGLLRSYYVHDTGEDELGGIRGDVDPPNTNRGRALLRHKHLLENDWELTVEASYLSDRNFLEEWFESEFFEGKEQETLVYLKKELTDYTIFSMLGKWRINDFLTQVEHYPEAVIDVLGKPFADGRAVWYSENRVDAARYRTDNDVPDWLIDWTRYQDTDTVARADSRQEVEFPLSIGMLKMVPFAVIRGSAWDDSPFDGGLSRIFGLYGLRGSLYQWKVYDEIESRLFDIHRIRHVMKEDFTFWGAHSNVDPWELTPFDRNVEDLVDFDGFTAGWRHLFQTKRGGPGRWRTVDWLTLDLEAGFFNDSQMIDLLNRTRGRTFSYRPEWSIASNYLSLNSIYRVSDTTALVYDAIVDADHGELGLSGFGIHVDRDPRLSWFLGHRYVGLTESNLLGVGANYRLNRKYAVAVREEFDLGRGQNADLTLTLLRRLPRWYLALTVEFDETEDVDSVSLALWPEGIPEWTIGSRRYSDLATTTDVRP